MLKIGEFSACTYKSVFIHCNKHAYDEVLLFTTTEARLKYLESVVQLPITVTITVAAPL